jgi:MOSC domain-containing protein YiiM
MAGHIHQINVSPGGVPKLPVPHAYIDLGGVAGDSQADRRHHGGPDQALCLYSLEVIEGLRAEGHPIFPGAAGENLTVAGIEWAGMEAGTRLAVGEALVEVTFATTPCAKNAQWFADGYFNRMHQAKHPGWSRWYARVLRPGTVRVGDPVTEE